MKAYRFSLESGKRFCTNCQAPRPEAGGKWIISGNRLTKRWSCAACEDRKRAAQEQREIRR